MCAGKGENCLFVAYINDQAVGNIGLEGGGNDRRGQKDLAAFCRLLNEGKLKVPGSDDEKLFPGMGLCR